MALAQWRASKMRPNACEFFSARLALRIDEIGYM